MWKGRLCKFYYLKEKVNKKSSFPDWKYKEIYSPPKFRKKDAKYKKE